MSKSVLHSIISYMFYTGRCLPSGRLEGGWVSKRHKTSRLLEGGHKAIYSKKCFNTEKCAKRGISQSIFIYIRQPEPIAARPITYI